MPLVQPRDLLVPGGLHVKAGLRRVSHVDLAVPVVHGLVERELEPFRELVDGAGGLSGYYSFFTVDA